jgi:hypothetical protein
MKQLNKEVNKNKIKQPMVALFLCNKRLQKRYIKDIALKLTKRSVSITIKLYRY